MRTAVISDIHGNLEALEAVYDQGQRQAVEEWVCLGDVVGYGADPDRCLARVRDRCRATVLGNHDAAVAGRLDPSYFNRYALRAAEWTAERLNDAERAYLAGLPLVRRDRGALYVHAEPSDPESWGYVHSAAQVRAALAAAAARLCFIGHTHQPFVCTASDNGIRLFETDEGPVSMAADDRPYLVNVGSVGQPRDGDPRACFLIWDDSDDTLQMVRVAYDIAAAQRKIIDAGLPSFLAERLDQGH